MVIDKALYGLRNSGARWHEHFANVLKGMGFVPCRAEPDIWMRRNGDVYKYIAVYVDYLAIADKDPQAICNTITGVYKLKLKGTGPLTYHLGCDFKKDPDNTLAFGPKKYIEKMVSNYERMFQEKPKPTSSPLPRNNHPELDNTELLDLDGIKIYQSMIGAIQWAVSLGRFDVHTAVIYVKILHRPEKRYGSGFVAARIATEQISDIRLTLRYLGSPIIGKSIMYGDNMSVIISATIPTSSQRKQNNALSYHRVHKAIAAKILQFCKINGKINPADILSKHCAGAHMYQILRPLLFWRGDKNLHGSNNTDTTVDNDQNISNNNV
jgi:Reverse transcriptase (RNA-dependent DNA polymerase)